MATAQQSRQNFHIIKQSPQFCDSRVSICTQMCMQQTTNTQNSIFDDETDGLHSNTFQIPFQNNQSTVTSKEAIVNDFFDEKLHLGSYMASRDRTDEWIEQHNSLPWFVDDTIGLGVGSVSQTICPFSRDNQQGDGSSLSSPNTVWTSYSNSADLTDGTWCSSSLSSNSATEFDKSSGSHQHQAAQPISHQKKLEVEFLSSTQNTKKDSTKFTKCAQVVASSDENRPPTVYTARGRPIDISIKCNHQPPPGARLRFLVFALTGGLRSPVVGSDGHMNASDEGQNLCFVQQPKQRNNETSIGFYEQLPGGFLSLSIPVLQKEFITTLTFPYHNSKCLSSLRKDVRLNITLVSSANEPISETEFQLVSCYSPVRDAMRHREKLNDSGSESVKPNRESNLKRMNTAMPQSQFQDTPVFKKSKSNEDEATVTEVDGHLKYIIMTDNFEVWKILENLRQQLTPFMKARNSTTAT